MIEKQVNFQLISRKFDNFIEESIKNKNNHPNQLKAKDNSIEVYLAYLQNRIKIKHQARQQKFQRNLTSLKRLKSFVSIQGFLSTLTLNNDDQITTLNSILSEKKQVNLRQYYKQKVQNHLRQYKIERKINQNAANLLKALQAQMADRNDNQFNTNIPNDTQQQKMQIVELQTLQGDNQYKYQLESVILPLQEVKQNKKNQVFNKRTNNYYKSQRTFQKINTLLCNRLKNILTKKYCSSGQKKYKSESEDRKSRPLRLKYQPKKLPTNQLKKEPKKLSICLLNKQSNLGFSKVKTEISKSKFMKSKRVQTYASNDKRQLTINKDFKRKIQKILQIAKGNENLKRLDIHHRNLSGPYY